MLSAARDIYEIDSIFSTTARITLQHLIVYFRIYSFQYTCVNKNEPEPTKSEFDMLLVSWATLT